MSWRMFALAEVIMKFIMEIFQIFLFLDNLWAIRHVQHRRVEMRSITNGEIAIEIYICGLIAGSFDCQDNQAL